MYKQAITIGAILAALAVILGAFGAHGLKSLVTPERLQVFETGVRYHFYHSIALIIAGILYAQYPVRQMKLATLLFIIGIALFSGSLYAIVFSGIYGGSIGPLGVLTPIGGVFFIIAWVLMAIGVMRKA
ncbi:DUF423 domain-containing protein [Nemorincola caseinilytica]|uniref:DUF423 domain-containing protein n=1 Tax=Nemorincola caseinilytica TaxID=2054315 RepID=A0ABP8N9Z6_9BACT